MKSALGASSRGSPAQSQLVPAAIPPARLLLPPHDWAARVGASPSSATVQPSRDARTPGPASNEAATERPILVGSGPTLARPTTHSQDSSQFRGARCAGPVKIFLRMVAGRFAAKRPHSLARTSDNIGRDESQLALTVAGTWCQSVTVLQILVQRAGSPALNCCKI